VPDILLTAKALGGGMPVGAFISSEEMMNTLTENPVLGHITTFGGHPVSCAAAIANVNYIVDNKIWEQVKAKNELFLKLLVHPCIKEVRSRGLMIAVDLKNEALAWKVLNRCKANGLLTDSFLFCPTSIRFAPPLIINEDEIKEACRRFILSLNEV